LNITELRKEIASRVGIKEKVVSSVLKEFVNLIMETLSNGGSVVIRSFGTFFPKFYKKVRMNTWSGKTKTYGPAIIPDRFKVFFDSTYSINKRLMRMLEGKDWVDLVIELSGGENLVKNCHVCGGSGKLEKDKELVTCHRCKGSGKEPKKLTEDIDKVDILNEKPVLWS